MSLAERQTLHPLRAQFQQIHIVVSTAAGADGEGESRAIR